MLMLLFQEWHEANGLGQSSRRKDNYTYNEHLPKWVCMHLCACVAFNISSLNMEYQEIKSCKVHISEILKDKPK